MNERELELTTLIYALGDAIQVKDWPTAHLIWERLLLVHSPLAQTHSDVLTVLRRNAELVHLAGNQTRHIH
jgi:hypothetical protein